MTGMTHQMIALVALLWILTTYSVHVGPVVGLLIFLATMIGALTPDIDHPASHFWRRILGGALAGSAFRLASGGHRNLTHSVLGILLISFALRWVMTHILNQDYAVSGELLWRAFMLGYLSHIIADTLTDRGVPWLWPLPWAIKIPPGPEIVRVTTGSFVEMLLLRGALIISALFIVYSHYGSLLAIFR